MILHPLDRLPAQFENKFILRIDFFDGIGVSYIAQIRRYRTMVRWYQDRNCPIYWLIKTQIKALFACNLKHDLIRKEFQKCVKSLRFIISSWLQ